MNWLGFSLLALGLWGVWGFLGKVAAQHLPSQQVYLLAVSGHLAVVGYLLMGGLGAVSWQPWGVGAALGAGLAMALGAPLFLRGPGPGSRHRGGAPHRPLPGHHRALKPDFPPGSPDPAPSGRPRPGVGGRLALVQIVRQKLAAATRLVKKIEITGKMVYYKTVSCPVLFLHANGIEISSLIPPKKNLMAEPSMRVYRLFSPIMIILALGAFLLLFHLDHRPFWQDEAETAVLAKRVLEYGVPRAYDGVNLVSQEAGHEYGPNYLWRWSPWLQIYVAAGAFRLGGSHHLRRTLALCVPGTGVYFSGLPFGEP